LKIRCDKEKYISAFMDAELPDHQMEEIRSHLRTCERCRQHLALLQETEAALKAMPEIEPSPSFESDFWKKIADREDRRNHPFLLRFFLTHTKPFAAAAMTAAIVAVLLFNRETTRPPEIDEIVIAKNLELFQDLQEVDHLELLENWESIIHLDERS